MPSTSVPAPKVKLTTKGNVNPSVVPSPVPSFHCTGAGSRSYSDQGSAYSYICARPRPRSKSGR